MRKKILLFFIVIPWLFNNHVANAEGPKNYLKGKFYSSVKNHFLIATEKMKDSRFNKTVIVMLESDESGAWGFVINKQLGSMPIAMLINPSVNPSKDQEKLLKIKQAKNHLQILILQDYNAIIKIIYTHYKRSTK